ncbi:MAG TPA: hypothetical protein VGO65_01440 [Pseudolysinimonas sp.]|jgi:Flp pilus assembly protein TadG|nr:hypothetical protein [Pseudolysinimonas sp.]
MRPSRRWSDESGSASLEFITAGVVLLVPIVYLILALSAVQAATLAVDGAARQATRVYVQSASTASARSAAARAIAVTLADYGLDAAAASVEIGCRPRADACLTRRGFVTVTIRMTVPLPLAPPFLDTGLPAGLPVEATATEQVSRFWGAR